MKKLICVGNIVLGDGTVHICVPVVASDIEEIERQCSLMKHLPCELVEIRMDFFTSLEEADLREVFHRIRDILSDKVLLATFRSLEEGGNKPLFDEAYERLYTVLIEHHLCDMIDLEASRPLHLTDALQKKAEKQGIHTILSSHDFQGTAPREVLIARLLQMAERKADIVKLAVMPHTEEDVFCLMDAVRCIHAKISQPVIAMAMGDIGRRSRIEAASFGSCVTFACAEKTSAPGQIPCAEMRCLLDEHIG